MRRPKYRKISPLKKLIYIYELSTDNAYIQNSKSITDTKYSRKI